MENKIYNVSSEDFIKIKEKFLEDKTLFVAEIHGKEIKTLQDYFNRVSIIFKFPIPSRYFSGYDDWMRDLDWLEKDGYVLVIYEYEDLLKQDSSSKKTIIDDFTDIILPWWEKEVEEFCVDGKAKPFNVYLVY